MQDLWSLINNQKSYVTYRLAAKKNYLHIYCSLVWLISPNLFLILEDRRIINISLYASRLYIKLMFGDNGPRRVSRGITSFQDCPSCLVSSAHSNAEHCCRLSLGASAFRQLPSVSIKLCISCVRAYKLCCWQKRSLDQRAGEVPCDQSYEHMKLLSTEQDHRSIKDGSVNSD